ncbi:MAG: hypothetical protein QW318_07970, partial [Candidatus Caldarchaeum sp.]
MKIVFDNLTGLPKGVAGTSQGAFAVPSGGLSDEQMLGLVASPLPNIERKNTDFPVYFNPATNEFDINGRRVLATNYADILNAVQSAGAPRQSRPSAREGWQPMPLASFQQYLRSITDPSTGRRFSKSFRTGVLGMKDIAGSSLQLLGAEKTGQRIRDSAEERITQLSPFASQIENVIDGEDSLMDWAVSNFGQALPTVLGSVVAGITGAGVGAAAGAATKSPALLSTASTLARLLGSQHFSKTVATAAAKHAAGQALTLAERKALLTAAGSVAGLGLYGYGMGIGDTYGEMRDKGAAPDDMRARIVAAAAGVPYAALETIPELLFIRRFFGGAPLGKSLLGRISKAAGIGALAEGMTELGQESLTVGAGSAYGSYDEDEVLSRLVNATLAGMLVGGVFGGVAGLKSNRPADLLGEPPPPEKEPVFRSNLFPDKGNQVRPVSPVTDTVAFTPPEMSQRTEGPQLNLFEETPDPTLNETLPSAKDAATIISQLLESTLGQRLSVVARLAMSRDTAAATRDSRVEAELKRIETEVKNSQLPEDQKRAVELIGKFIRITFLGSHKNTRSLKARKLLQEAEPLFNELVQEPIERVLIPEEQVATQEEQPPVVLEEPPPAIPEQQP